VGGSSTRKKENQMSETIRLGQKVRDRVSGIEGIVTSRCDPLTGATQFGVQPMGKGDTVIDAQFVDHFTLQIKGDGISAECPPIDSSVTVGLQDTVRDRISGVTGTVIERIIFLNGCVFFVVQPEAPTSGDRKGQLPDRISFAHARLEVVKPAVERAPAATVKKSSTGGPSRSVRSVIGA